MKGAKHTRWEMLKHKECMIVFTCTGSTTIRSKNKWKCLFS